jgi:hypothetical protein
MPRPRTPRPSRIAVAGSGTMFTTAPKTGAVEVKVVPSFCRKPSTNET